MRGVGTVSRRLHDDDDDDSKWSINGGRRGHLVSMHYIDLEHGKDAYGGR